MRFVSIAVPRVISLTAVLLLHTSFVNAQIEPMPVTSPAVDTLTIEKVIAQVLRRNDRISAAGFMQLAAERKAASTGGWEDPMLMLGIENAPTSFDLDMDDMTMRMVGISQSIPYSGQSSLAKKAAKAEATAAQFELHSRQVDMVRAAKMAYADFYYRSNILKDISAQYDLMKLVIESAKSRLTTNQGSQAEVLAAQAEQWRIQTELYEADHMVDEARHMLNILRGADVDVVVSLAAPPATIIPPQLPDEWITEAFANSTELQTLSRKAEAYGLFGAASRRMNWPMFGVSASYGFRSGYSTDHTGLSTERDDMVSIGASVSLPIFSRSRNNRMAASMEAMQKSVGAESTLLKREIESKVRLLHLTAQHLEISVNLYQTNIIPADQEAFQSALAGYTANRVMFTDLLEYVQMIYKDRRMFNQFSNQFAQVSAEIQSLINDPKHLVEDEVIK